MTYQLISNQLTGKVIVRKNEDGSITSFGENPDNTDYQTYLAWVAEGNTPLPADEVKA